MKSLRIMGMGLSVLLVSCVQYPQRVTYQLVNGYDSAKSQLTGYHRSQETGMNFIHDGRSSQVDEVVPGKKTIITFNGRAPEGGGSSFTLYHVTLEKAYSGSRLQITNVTPSGYDLPREISGCKLCRMEEVDAWVMANMKVKNRAVDEDTNARPNPDFSRW